MKDLSPKTNIIITIKHSYNYKIKINDNKNSTLYSSILQHIYANTESITNTKKLSNMQCSSKTTYLI